MKHEIKAVIKKWYAYLRFPKKYDEQFKNILETEEIDETITAENYDISEKNGRKNLLMNLYFLEELEKKYIEKGIPKAIFDDTFSDIVRWTKVWSDLKGELWLEEQHWLKLHFSFKLFKIGRLQFYMSNADNDFPDLGIKSDMPMLDVHIPRTGPLDPYECEKSFDMAKAFFGKFFPEFEYEHFKCFSWLLDKTLLQFLKPDSNIAKFQQMFTVIQSFDTQSFLGFVFRWNITAEDLPDFVPATKFAEDIKTAFLNGTQFHSGYGIRKA